MCMCDYERKVLVKSRTPKTQFGVVDERGRKLSLQKYKMEQKRIMVLILMSYDFFNLYFLLLLYQIVEGRRKSQRFWLITYNITIILLACWSYTLYYAPTFSFLISISTLNNNNSIKYWVFWELSEKKNTIAYQNYWFWILTQLLYCIDVKVYASSHPYIPSRLPGSVSRVNSPVLLNA